MSQIQARLAALQNAGLRKSHTRAQFTEYLLSIGLAVYEKQILPYERDPQEPEQTTDFWEYLLRKPDTGVKAQIIPFRKQAEVANV